MPTLSALQGAIWGQFVGDAAALGTHWIYDLKDMARDFPGGIEGFETPKKGHYHEGKQSGDQTHYGDAALLLLESVAACGEFREADFGLRFEAYFRRPGCKSYRDHSTRDTLANLEAEPGDFQNGAIDDEPATVSRLAPVVVAHGEDPRPIFTDAIRRLTLVTQNHPMAVACAAAHAELLRILLTGKPFREAFEETRKSPAVSCDGSDYFEFAYMMRNLDTISATDRLGQACPLAQSFPSALLAAWQHPDNFQDAVLATIRAGGDNAGRASMIGAWMGAALGLEAIPPAWLSRLRERDRIQSAIDQLLTRRGEGKSEPKPDVASDSAGDKAD
jgi:ADP-ribosylglycohydrolase